MGFGAFLGGVQNSAILNGNSYSGNVHEKNLRKIIANHIRTNASLLLKLKKNPNKSPRTTAKISGRQH